MDIFLTLWLWCLIALNLGVIIGWQVGKRGFLAHHALQDRQGLIYCLFGTAIAIFIVLALSIDFNKITRIPVIAIVYVAEFAEEAILGWGGFVWGLFVAWEYFGRSSRRY
ncbi:MAG: hypothetical protein J7647_31470 [Cyanobacteria bacterium SBLK]|nr:hypothetical protein [Cyanobacteria bacterium SBLK]